MVKDKEVKEIVEEGDKLTNGDVFMATASFTKLVEVDFPIKDSIALRKLVQKLSEPLKIVEDVRNGLVRKHGQEALKGSGQLEIIGPNDPKGRPQSKTWLKFMEEFAELMNTEVKVDFEKVKLPSEIDGKPIQMSVADLGKLEKFVEFV